MPDRSSLPLSPSLLPRIDPATWEEFEGFRRTFLMYFSRPGDDLALARISQLAFEMALEYSGHWPDRPMTSPREEAIAGLDELRFIQGFFRSLGEEHQISVLDVPDTRLSVLAGDIALDLKVLGDRFAAELARGEGSAR
jgi:hypothetical protein